MLNKQGTFSLLEIFNKKTEYMKMHIIIFIDLLKVYEYYSGRLVKFPTILGKTTKNNIKPKTTKFRVQLTFPALSRSWIERALRAVWACIQLKTLTSMQ